MSKSAIFQKVVVYYTTEKKSRVYLKRLIGGRYIAMSVPVSVNKELHKDAVNAVKEDFLDVDTPIPGQNFVCLSFVSPEKTLKEKYLWCLSEFLKDLFVPMTIPIADNPDNKSTKIQEFLKTGKIDYNEVKAMWDDFMFLNEQKLNDNFDKKSDFQTSVRGVKIRGTYESYKQAKRRADQLAETNKSFHVYIGQVGYWLPWDPNPDNIEDQQYQEKELNALMKNYKENLASKDMFYNERKQEKLQEAQERLRKQKEETKQETPDTAEAVSNINKMRHIVDEKNNIMFSAMKDKQPELPTQPVPVTPVTPVTPEIELSDNQEQVDDSKVVVDTSTMFQEPDTWMARKLEQQRLKSAQP